MDAAITPRDRLSFALFLAISLHAAIILGVGFVWTMERVRAPTIEVTLAQHDDLEAPERADFLAQHNQLGSGDAADTLETTTTEEAVFHDTVFRSVQETPVMPQEERKATDPFATVTTRSARDRQSSSETVAESERVEAWRNSARS
ncbi:MAG: hypothetical protein HC809_00830 [Gammaproteobacteria bacterium]|nr:hypothetical protein [Gammaproteobacteria bacterium]